MKYNDLISKCIAIIKTFNPIVDTVDSHSDEFLSKVKDDNERVFIKQVFYGSYRYEEFLKAFNNTLFNTFPAKTNRNDGTLYSVFVYIVCFRLTEFPLEEFRHLVMSQDPVKMNVMLQFLFDGNMIEQYLRPEWIKIYDPSYIDDVVIGNIEANLSEVAELLNTISEKATGTKTELTKQFSKKEDDEEARKREWKPTKPEEFNLTKPKPKAAPEPFIIERRVEVNPVPKYINKTTLSEIEAEKLSRRKKIEQETQMKYALEATSQAPVLETHKRPGNLEKLKAEIEAKRAAEMQDRPKITKTRPKEDPNAEVKLTMAAIIKEEAIIKRKGEAEAKKMKDFEMNMRDSKEFEDWKKTQNDILDRERTEHMQRKKIEMEISREAAMRAYDDKVLKNKENVVKMKHFSAEGQVEREVNAEEDRVNKTKLIATVLESRGNAAKLKLDIIEENKEKHDALEQELTELRERKRLEDEAMQKKREELIRAIREMEKMPRVRTSGFDPTETKGYGLLEEMSLVELRERLILVKQMREEERETRRIANSQARDEVISEIHDKVKTITAYREDLKVKKLEEREERKRKLEEEQRKKEEFRQKSLLEVHEKIQAKKDKQQKEQDRIARELREINLKRQYLNANHAMVEEKAWENLENGAEREILARQNDRLMGQERMESIRLKERSVLAEAAKRDIGAKVEFGKKYDQRLEAEIRSNEVLYREERNEKVRKHEVQRTFEAAHTQNMIDMNPFKTKMAEFSLTNAKNKSIKDSMKITNKTAHNRTELELPGARYNNQSHVTFENSSKQIEQFS